MGTSRLSPAFLRMEKMVRSRLAAIDPFEIAELVDRLSAKVRREPGAPRTPSISRRDWSGRWRVDPADNTALGSHLYTPRFIIQNLNAVIGGNFAD